MSAAPGKPKPLMTLTPDQRRANKLIAGPAQHVCVYGGSRSGKTFVICRAILERARRYPRSRHLIGRLRLNHVVNSIGRDTLPKVASLHMPGERLDVDKTNWIFRLENGSEVYLAGLDSKDRTEKILGLEFGTIYLNECSQIGYNSVLMVRSRLAQRIQGLKPRMLYDLNPSSKKSWIYKEFIEHVNPVDGSPYDPSQWVSMQINPEGNRENIAEGYLQTLESMPLRERRRFLMGEFSDDDEVTLWSADMFQRVARVDDIEELVVAVDPSGSAGGDEAGIVASGRKGNEYYVLRDRSLKGTPERWAREAVRLYDEMQADRIVVERNFGGDMCRSTLTMVAREMHRAGERPTDHVALEDVVASRGKVLRAEPVSALYEAGQVYHVGKLNDLEDECCSFTSTWRRGEHDSPNRVDALVFSISHLMRRAPTARRMVFGTLRRS